MRARRLDADEFPLVSVVMPVWNGERFLHEALDSLLRQSYPAMEIIVVDDCSQDETASILGSFHDSRLRIVTNDSNIGIASSLLKGISVAQGVYIARMDADDISSSFRLGRQVAFMERHKEVDVLGTAAVLFGRGIRRYKSVPRTDSDIKAELIFRSPLIHPTVMFRKTSIRDWYDPSVGAAEDYDLWARLALARATFANLGVPSLRYRLHGDRTSELRAEVQQTEASNVGLTFVQSAFGLRDLDPGALRVLSRRYADDVDAVRSALQLALDLLDVGAREGAQAGALRHRIVLEVSALLLRTPVRRDAWASLSRRERRVLWVSVLRSPSGALAGAFYAATRALTGHG